MTADPYELERRKFLALLGAAGAYATPALAGLLGSSQIVSAQSSVSLSESLSTVTSGSLSSSLILTSSGLLSSGSGSIGLSSSSSSGYPYTPPTVTLYADADAFLRSESPNTNEGWNPLLRVGVGPGTRAVVLFDRNAVLSSLMPGATITLALRIAFNGNNWGQQDNRTVDVYPLLEDFVEGNGRQSGMPGSEAVRGSGAGATWFSPDDPNVSDDSPRGARRRWDGGRRVGPKTAAGAVHVNQVVETDVTWDVTQDVLAGYPVVGWLIKVTDEGDDHGSPFDRGDRHRGRDGDDDHGRLPAGDDRGVGGTIWYYSSQGAGLVSNQDYGPRLIMTFPTDGGSSSTSLSSLSSASA